MTNNLITIVKCNINRIIMLTCVILITIQILSPYMFRLFDTDGIDKDFGFYNSRFLDKNFRLIEILRCNEVDRERILSNCDYLTYLPIIQIITCVTLVFSLIITPLMSTLLLSNILLIVTSILALINIEDLYEELCDFVVGNGIRTCKKFPLYSINYILIVLSFILLIINLYHLKHPFLSNVYKNRRYRKRSGRTN